MSRALPLLLATLILGACASTPIPDVTRNPDWKALAGESVPTLVTVDPDGEERATKLWVAVVDGRGYVRTGESRWNANLNTNPDAVLRIGGSAYPVRAVGVSDELLRKAINRAFREKYGFQDRMVSWFSDRSASNIWRLASR